MTDPTLGYNLAPGEEQRMDQAGKSTQTPGYNLAPGEEQRMDQAGKRDQTQPSSGNANGHVHLNDEKYNADGQKGRGYNNQDFSNMPAGLFNSAVREAEQLMALARQKGIDMHNTQIGQIAESLDPAGQHKVTKDGLASVLLASDMAPESSTGYDGQAKVRSEFHNSVTVDLKEPAKSGTDVAHIRPEDGTLKWNDPKIVFAEAQQILKAARPEEVPEGTTPTPGQAANTIADHTVTSAKC